MATWTKVVIESSAGNIAQEAATAGTADNITSQGQLATLDTIDTGNINSSAIETAKINNSAVTTAKINDDAVTNAKIADNAVSEAKLYSQNSASNGQVLSFSGSDAFTWVDQTSQVTVDASISSSSSNPVENHVVYDQLALKVGMSGNETVAGNKTFSGDISIANLEVTGSTTTVNTEEINLADNFIKLNSNATGTPSATTDVGIEIERGDSTNVKLLWDEGEDRWKVHLGGLGSSTFIQTVQVSTSGTAPTADLDGVGMMYMANGVPYIRTV